MWQKQLKCTKWLKTEHNNMDHFSFPNFFPKYNFIFIVSSLFERDM